MGRDDERDGGHHSKRRKHSHGEKDGRERDKGLPFHARKLTKEDMDEYRGVFAKYLKDRKGIHIDDVSSTEAYARFKSFVHKWNEGDLSSKYYDPENNRKRTNLHGHEKDSRQHSSSRQKGIYPRSSSTVGPTLPTQEDLQLQKEHFAEEADEAQHMHKLERKHQRRVEKERLEELLPRSDAGTRERKMEKRAETNAANRAFREKSPEVTVSDATLMGGDDIKADLLNQKRIEAAREARREEIQRSKEAERLKRRSDLEKREDGTMEMLKRLAEERWGKQ